MNSSIRLPTFRRALPPRRYRRTVRPSIHLYLCLSACPTNFRPHHHLLILDACPTCACACVTGNISLTVSRNSLIHTTPHLNLTPLDSSSAPSPLLLSNLEKLNSLGPEDVYLTSNDDPAYPPPWLRGNRNIPDHYGKSRAPAIIIWAEKSPGVIDAFYFYFYSFNLGNTVAGWRFGNHVGDWGEC